jgi:hypothetical protein
VGSYFFSPQHGSRQRLPQVSPAKRLEAARRLAEVPGLNRYSPRLLMGEIIPRITHASLQQMSIADKVFKDEATKQQGR